MRLSFNKLIKLVPLFHGVIMLFCYMLYVYVILPWSKVVPPKVKDHTMLEELMSMSSGWNLVYDFIA